MRVSFYFISIFTLFFGACEPAGSDVAEMIVTSPAFGQGEAIPVRHTCYGDDLSVPLQFQGVPSEARSLCVVMEDLDGVERLRTRWVAWAVPPQTLAVDEDGMGRVRGAVVGKNDLDQNGYSGPCRPAEAGGPERRRYRITVRALDVIPNLAPTAGLPQLQKAVDGHVVAQGSLTGRYFW